MGMINPCGVAPRLRAREGPLPDSAGAPPDTRRPEPRCAVAMAHARWKRLLS